MIQKEKPAPVLFIVFKRPDTTARVFEAIRKARPPVLYVAADGPRTDRPGEAELTLQVRSIATAVDWPCRVETRFRAGNAGIKTNVSEAISWFLNAENEGIILEDDCCPSTDFFTFARDMLEQYRTNERVYHISGSCFQPIPRGNSTFFFSRYNHGWGWATWKRAWNRCDLDMETLDDFLSHNSGNGFWDSSKERQYWTKIFRDQKAGLIDTWDYQWKFTLWRDAALAIYPNFNMVSNLGFNDQGTNTLSHDTGKADRGWEVPIVNLQSAWIIPDGIIRNKTADRWTFLNMYWGLPWERLKARLQKIVSITSGKKK